MKGMAGERQDQAREGVVVILAAVVVWYEGLVWLEGYRWSCDMGQSSCPPKMTSTRN